MRRRQNTGCFFVSMCIGLILFAIKVSTTKSGRESLKNLGTFLIAIASFFLIVIIYGQISKLIEEKRKKDEEKQRIFSNHLAGKQDITDIVDEIFVVDIKGKVTREGITLKNKLEREKWISQNKIHEENKFKKKKRANDLDDLPF